MSSRYITLTPAYDEAVEQLSKNPSQWRIFESSGHCVALAGPGSGKTKTLTTKLTKMLVEEISPPRGVACITYSSECARELKRRIQPYGIKEHQNTFVGTVHSFCLKNILMPYASLLDVGQPETLAVASTQERNLCLQSALEQVYGDERLPGTTDFDYYRRTYLDRHSKQWHTQNAMLAQAIELFEKKLRELNRIDFDDMVLLGLRAVEQNHWLQKILKARFPVLVVDEYQDLGLPLHRLVDCLCFKVGIRLLAVGDPDQSIYGFTGANPRLLQELAERDDVEEVKLAMNYRCGVTIVRASEIVLGKEVGEYKTPDHAEVGTIEFFKYPGGIQEQARKICTDLIPRALSNRENRKLGDIAILYVNKNDGNVIAREATAARLDFIRIDQNAPYAKTPLTRWLEECALWCCGGWEDQSVQLSDIIYTWLSFNSEGDVSKEQRRTLRSSLVSFLWGNRNSESMLQDWLISFKTQCLQKFLYPGCIKNDAYESLEQLLNACGETGQLAGFTVRNFAGQAGSPDHLNLITLHSAKGLEYEVVIMMGMDQGHIPWLNEDVRKKAEKRRLFFVGVTRAMHEVYMTYSGWFLDYYGRKKYKGPSEFLALLQKKLLEPE